AAWPSCSPIGWWWPRRRRCRPSSSRASGSPAAEDKPASAPSAGTTCAPRPTDAPSAAPPRRPCSSRDGRGCGRFSGRMGDAAGGDLLLGALNELRQRHLALVGLLGVARGADRHLIRLRFLLADDQQVRDLFH